MPGMMIKAMANAMAELHIDGEIGGWGVYASELREQLKAAGTISELTVYLNSPGGSVIEGLNIYNLLNRLDAHIKVVITGLAASMGSVIAMAGDEIEMAEGTLLMIHNPWGGALGEAKDLRKVADVLDKMKASLTGIYEKRTGLSREEITALMDEETWMDSLEAIEKGFITTVTDAINDGIDIETAKAMVASLSLPENEMSKLAASAKAEFLQSDETGEYRFALINKASITPKPKPAPTKPEPTEGRSSQTNSEEEQDMPKDIAALTERNNSITKLFAKHTQLTELKAECLADVNLSIEEVKDKLLEALGATEQPVGGFEVIADAKDKAKTGMEKALSARAGIISKDDEANEFRGYTLTEMARKMLQLNNQTPVGDKMVVIGQAFTHSTSDFGNMLANVANKAMLKGFEEAPETFDQFTGVGDLPDFKENTRTDIGPAPSLRQVKEGGEFKHITFGDKGATAMLATYGELFGITRQAIINDDLGAFTRVPQKMGRAARRTVGDLVFAQLVANAHYSAANQKTSAALSSDNLDALRVLMATRKDGAVTTGVRPSFLLVPEALSGKAKQCVEAEFMVDAAAKDSQQPNIARNMAQVISDYRLDADDPARYYLLASAMMYDALDVLYLDGNPNPFLDQQQGWNIDGTTFKVRIDAAAKLWDNRSVARGKA